MTAAVSSEPFLFSPGESAGSASGAGASDGTESYRGDRGAETLVNQARQEISQIVREVASAQQNVSDRDQYLRFLADRILRAMAAHGVVIWNAEGTLSDLQFVAEHRLGTVTDRQFDKTSWRVHECLLLEVAGQNSPVVVPPTPDSSDPDVPANPTGHPAAIVPVQVDPMAALPTCFLEVFLEPGGSPASQRGSLRFLAQMGDLAGEFLRAEHSRSLTRRLSTMDQCQRACDQMQALISTARIEGMWVDSVASIIESPRVALCRVDRGRPKVVAVSHVDRIDQYSEAAEAIRHAASVEVSGKGNVKFAVLKDEVAGRPDSAPERRSGERRQANLEKQPVRPHWVASLRGDPRWRMVVLQRDDDVARSKEPDREMLEAMERLLVGGQQAWTAAYRVEAIPGGRWWSRLTSSDEIAGNQIRTNESSGEGTPGSLPQQENRTWLARLLWLQPGETVSPLRRQLVLVSAVTLTIVFLLCVPIPSVIPVTGVIRPVELDTYHARHDATVQLLHVNHGQSVKRGDLLATLQSDDLSARQTSLLGRRAVLSQKREQTNRNLVSATRGTESLTGLPSGDEIDEEILSIDQQLEIISKSQADLVLRARRDGLVDAWRLRERLSNRPLRRGDAVLSVIAEETTWVVDATIPQRRVHRIDHALENDSLVADVSPRWSTSPPQSATAHRFGPVVTDPVDGTPGVVLRMNLATTPHLGDQPLVETPARVAMHCGRTSVGAFLFEDVIGWLKTRVGMYL